MPDIDDYRRPPIMRVRHRGIIAEKLPPITEMMKPFENMVSDIKRHKQTLANAYGEKEDN